jgi:copper chaperone CopZ
VQRGVVLEVEQAGCSSCAARVSAALGAVGRVEEVVVDETGDTAAVRLSGAVTPSAVSAALELASEGSGHSYRIREGSWRTL